MILSTFHRNLNRKKIENREVVSKTPSTNFSELMEFQITLASNALLLKVIYPKILRPLFSFMRNDWKSTFVIKMGLRIWKFMWCHSAEVIDELWALIVWNRRSRELTLRRQHCKPKHSSEIFWHVEQWKFSLLTTRV